MNVIPITQNQSRAGEVTVYPCSDHGGSWAVDHTSRSGDACARIGEWLDVRDARFAAIRTAAAVGASLHCHPACEMADTQRGG